MTSGKKCFSSLVTRHWSRNSTVGDLNSPPWQRRGGRAIKKYPRSLSFHLGLAWDVWLTPKGSLPNRERRARQYHCKSEEENHLHIFVAVLLRQGNYLQFALDVLSL